ncbi:glycosyltransferase involved in cell wall biosynthesis [Evansella vedderi]|uniref:Glycosyltransferase involved in cell wall biosynthesis n=1 Tax=Evansella vedderi TaxID=38282 RepID=A0ABT9ZZA6_9BACI|nr:glycosyltransferase [Evansella vedderi]MDQ0256579.1 glycosyltransferase involved in cell wall biosynthesis [Evansella vedderi]
MKKDILFVMPSLAAGGGEKSLVNLLSKIDYDLYNVDLLLFEKSGEFMNLIPSKVNLLQLPTKYITFSTNIINSIKEFLVQGNIKLVYSRFMFSIKGRTIKNPNISEQKTWKYIGDSFGTLEKSYDVAIGFMEKSSIYFVVEKVKSKKKIGWIHTNYSNSGMNNYFDKSYFKQLNHIVTVSEECAKSLEQNFIEEKSKIKVIHNIVSPSIINNLSNNELPNNFNYESSFINIITIARLSYEKGIDIAVEACNLLINKGYKIKWYVIGDGKERGKLEELIGSFNLNDNFILLGTKANPYPFLKNSDIYVQPSRYEGKSIALDEAKILQKPIIVTNYDTSKDQIKDGKNGMIVSMNAEGLYSGIKTLIEDDIKVSSFIKNLAKETQGTEEEVKKFYELI